MIFDHSSRRTLFQINILLFKIVFGVSFICWYDGAFFENIDAFIRRTSRGETEEMGAQNFLDLL